MESGPNRRCQSEQTKANWRGKEKSLPANQLRCLLLVPLLLFGFRHFNELGSFCWARTVRGWKSNLELPAFFVRFHFPRQVSSFKFAQNVTRCSVAYISSRKVSKSVSHFLRREGVNLGECLATVVFHLLLDSNQRFLLNSTNWKKSRVHQSSNWTAQCVSPTTSSLTTHNLTVTWKTTKI